MTYIKLFNYMIVFHFVLASDMGLHYLTFMERNLENKKELTLIWIMNCVNMIIRNIVNNANVSKDHATMNNKNIMNNMSIPMIMLLWIVILMNNMKMNNVYCEQC
jgi:hypothetical protein